MFKKTDILFYKETISLAFIIAASLSLIIIIVKLTAFTELLFASPNIFASLSLIFLYLLPPILTTVLPIAVFTASALVATRMAADREMDALFSSGMSVGQVLFAPFAVGVLTVFIMLGNSLYYEPYSKEQFRFFKWFQARQIVESFIINNLQEKSFIADFPMVDNNKVVFYTDSISKTNTLSNIFISFDNMNFNTDNIVIAEKGDFKKSFSNGYPDFIFSLQNSKIYSDNKTITQFGNMDISVLNMFGDKLKSEEEFEASVKTSPQPIDLKPFSAALCALFFPALGICLGLFNTHNKPYRVYLGIGALTIVFYALLSLCRIAITRLGLSPFLVYSIPPAIFCILTIWMVKERHKIK